MHNSVTYQDNVTSVTDSFEYISFVKTMYVMRNVTAQDSPSLSSNFTKVRGTWSKLHSYLTI